MSAELASLGRKVRIRSIWLLPLLLVLLLPGLAGPVHANFYAGYSFCGVYNACGNFYGIYDKENTINPFVPAWDFQAQWATVIFSYSPTYWVQAGYQKCGGWSSCWAFTTDTDYCEYVDGSGTHRSFLSYGPSPGSIYWYKIENMWFNGQPYTWNSQYQTGDWCSLKTQWTKGVDLQASPETTNSCIVITGTHFYSIEREDSSTALYLWTQASGFLTPPYSFSATPTPYEFQSSGGTGGPC